MIAASAAVGLPMDFLSATLVAAQGDDWINLSG